MRDVALAEQEAHAKEHGGADDECDDSRDDRFEHVARMALSVAVNCLADAPCSDDDPDEHGDDPGEGEGEEYTAQQK